MTKQIQKQVYKKLLAFQKTHFKFYNLNKENDYSSELTLQTCFIPSSKNLRKQETSIKQRNTMPQERFFKTQSVGSSVSDIDHELIKTKSRQQLLENIDKIKRRTKLPRICTEQYQIISKSFSINNCNKTGEEFKQKSRKSCQRKEKSKTIENIPHKTIQKIKPNLSIKSFQILCKQQKIPEGFKKVQLRKTSKFRNCTVRKQKIEKEQKKNVKCKKGERLSRWGFNNEEQQNSLRMTFQKFCVQMDL